MEVAEDIYLNPEFVNSMLSLFGEEEGSKLCNALKCVPSQSAVRMNPRKPCAPDFATLSSPVPWCPEGRLLAERPRFTFIPELHAGGFYVQEAASMIHAAIVRRFVTSPSFILDLCAAPGGKTSAIASAMPKGSMIIANEYSPQRANILKENVQKWGYPEIAVTNSGAEAFGALEGLFDVVVADAPCSGEGMMRKDEDARRQWTPSLVEKCAALQREILTEGVRALKPGGLLIYSTCTFNCLENEDNAEWLREEYGLELLDMNPDPAWGISPAVGGRIPAMRFFPHKTPSEGLFVCVLRKPEADTRTFRFPKEKKGKKERKVRVPELPWIKDSTDYEIFMRGEIACAVPKEWYPHFRAVEEKAKVVCAGLEAGEMKGKDIIPTHAAVISTAYLRGAFPEKELSRDEAIAYLRRDPIFLSSSPKGILIPVYGGLPLGRLNNLGSRTNSLYPKNFRILSRETDT